MRTFHIPINLDLNRRGSREGHKLSRIVTQFASWFIEVQKMADDLNDTHLQRSTQTV